MKHYLTADTVNGIMEWDDLENFGEEAPEIVDEETFERMQGRMDDEDYIAAEITDERIYSRLSETYGIVRK